jgi:hypothetical protein
MTKKKIDIMKAVRILMRKGVFVDERSMTLDLERAKELGNKTWGYIQLFANAGYKIMNANKYRNFNDIKYGPSKDEGSSKKKVNSIEPLQARGGLYHAYATIKERDITSGFPTSEYYQYQQAIDMVRGYKRTLEPITKEERQLLKERKATAAFGNDIVFQSEFNSPLKQRRV